MTAAGIVMALLWAGLSAAATPPAAAETEPLRLEGPLDISSDRLVVEQDKGRAVFSGNVLLRREKIEIRCRELVVEYAKERRPEAVERLFFSGPVEIQLENGRGGCQNAEYQHQRRLLICNGEAWLDRGEDRIAGEKMEYRLDNRQVTVSRPRAVIKLDRLAGEGKNPHGDGR